MPNSHQREVAASSIRAFPVCTATLRAICMCARKPLGSAVKREHCRRSVRDRCPRVPNVVSASGKKAIPRCADGTKYFLSFAASAKSNVAPGIMASVSAYDSARGLTTTTSTRVTMRPSRKLTSGPHPRSKNQGSASSGKKPYWRQDGLENAFDQCVSRGPSVPTYFVTVQGMYHKVCGRALLSARARNRTVVRGRD